MRLPQVARFRLGGAIAWTFVLLAVAGCTEARKKREPKATAPAASTAPAAGTATPGAAARAAEAGATAPAAASGSPAPAVAPGSTAPAAAPVTTSNPASASAPAVAAAAPVLVGLDPSRVTGKVKLSLSLPKPIRLGGFSFSATHDASRMTVAAPVTEAALQGYMCQSNLTPPGHIRFNCAGLVGEDRGGRLATFEVGHAGAAPTLADFQVTGLELVDDLATKVEGIAIVLAVEPLAAP